MNLIIKILFATTSLNLGLGVVAAQEPVQEPIQETRTKAQWKQEVFAFMAGLHDAKSIVCQLPQYVARDICALAKPKEEYGFIKNCTDRSIEYFGLNRASDHHSSADAPLIRSLALISRRKMLVPGYQICFIPDVNKAPILADSERFLISINGKVQKTWITGKTDELFCVCLQFANHRYGAVADNVHFFNFMNIKVYEEKGSVYLEVTSPYRASRSYPADWLDEDVYTWSSSPL